MSARFSPSTLVNPRGQQGLPVGINVAAGSSARLLNPRSTSSSGHRSSLVAALLALACLFPYPAFPIGANSALQMGNIVTFLVLLPCLLVCWRSGPMWMYLALLLPLSLSALVAAITGHDHLDLCVKSILVWGISALTMVATQYYAPRHALVMLTAVAIATLIHTAVGAWQLYCFAQGVFPFEQIYINPSFLSVQDNAQLISQYVQRPFGIFPEPSAMAASLAPCVLIMTAVYLNLVRLRQQPAPWQRALFALAALGGLALIIMSRSGHAVITLAALAILATLWLRRCRSTPSTLATLIVILGVVLPVVVYFAAWAIADRTGGRSAVGNDSWEERSTSLLFGLKMWLGGGLTKLIFGVGPGLSAPVMKSVTGIDAIFSVLLVYIDETGLVGLAAVAWIAACLLRVWKASGYTAAWVAVAMVWVVGVTLTTSYIQLLWIWITIGWLSVWPNIFAANTQIVPAADTPTSDEGPTPPVAVATSPARTATGWRARR